MSLTTEQVTAIQTKLREAGYLYQEPNGVWDYHTQRGYQNYLADKHYVQNPMYAPQPSSMDEVPEALKDNSAQQQPTPAPKTPPQTPKSGKADGEGEGEGSKAKKQD